MDATKNELMMVATDALMEGNKARAITVLLECMTLSQALETLAPQRSPLVGDVLECSWGYDQTNVDYYQVVGVTKASVKLRRIYGKVVGGTTYTDEIVPVLDNWASAEVFTRRFKPNGKSSWGANISDGRGWASLWNGGTSTATASGFGH